VDRPLVEVSAEQWPVRVINRVAHGSSAAPHRASAWEHQVSRQAATAYDASAMPTR
jgi:hypothetical protein